MRQETAYKPFWYKNGKSAVFKTGINLISSDIFLILEKLPFHRFITRLYGIHTTINNVHIIVMSSISPLLEEAKEFSLVAIEFYKIHLKKKRALL